METLKLKTEPRAHGKGQAKILRQQGLVPVVLYGKGRESQSLQIGARELSKVIAEAGGHQLIALELENEEVVTLAREIQRDVIRLDYLHVDFQEVKMDVKVNTQIPLNAQGEAPAVLNLGGVLTQGLDQLDIECLPGDLVSEILVNIEGLEELNDSILVSDLQVPDTITVLSDPDSMVIKIEPPRLVETLEALDEEELEDVSAEPEVITEARDDDEEE